ncbi:hypothetical protein ONZ45_g4946 [Pleurotus djamor]|nr:hypothetical protein ONZ45_g4946 [Pleurotus djamor]
MSSVDADTDTQTAVEIQPSNFTGVSEEHSRRTPSPEDDAEKDNGKARQTDSSPDDPEPPVSRSTRGERVVPELDHTKDDEENSEEFDSEEDIDESDGDGEPSDFRARAPIKYTTSSGTLTEQQKKERAKKEKKEREEREKKEKERIKAAKK